MLVKIKCARETHRKENNYYEIDLVLKLPQPEIGGK